MHVLGMSKLPNMKCEVLACDDMKQCESATCLLMSWSPESGKKGVRLDRAKTQVIQTTKAPNGWF